MQTVIKGVVIEKRYEVLPYIKEITDENGESKTVYTGKPVLKCENYVSRYEEILRYAGEPAFNRYYNNKTKALSNEVNISETETVQVHDVIFRADLNEYHLFTDKVISTSIVNKDSSETAYREHMKRFNKQIIDSNEKMKDYCDLHMLKYEDTDAVKLFSLLYPDKAYHINNQGKIEVLSVITIKAEDCKPDKMWSFSSADLAIARTSNRII